MLIGDDVIQSEHPRIIYLEKKTHIDIIEKEVKEISRLREDQNDSSIRDILLKNVNGFNPLN